MRLRTGFLHLVITKLKVMGEVTFCHFEQLFDYELVDVLLKIFMNVDPGDLNNCIRVCHNWRTFIAR